MLSKNCQYNQLLWDNATKPVICKAAACFCHDKTGKKARSLILRKIQNLSIYNDDYFRLLYSVGNTLPSTIRYFFRQISTR